MQLFGNSEWLILMTAIIWVCGDKQMEAIKRVRLSEIAELITKGTTPTTLGYNFQEDGVNFLKIECFSEDGTYIKEKTAHISEECHEKLKRSKLRTGDILFSIAGAIGRVAVVTEEMLPANTNQALAIIRVTRDDIYLPYIKLILTSQIVKAQFERKKQGVAQLNISLKDINELEIPLPEKSKQIECASLLEKISGIITARQKQLQKLDELVKARFIELFGTETEFDKWPCCTIGDVADVCVGVVIKPTQYYTDKGIPAFRSLNIGEMHVKDSDWVYFTEEGHQKNQKSVVHKNDVLVVRSGAPGTACVATEKYDGYNAVDIIIAHPDNSKVNSIFLAAFTNMPHGMNQIRERTGGAAQQHFNVGGYKAMRLIMPSIELQNQYAAFVEQTDKSKVAIQKALDEAQLLFDSLMQKYFG